MKKVSSFILAATLVLSLAGCGAGSGGDGTGNIGDTIHTAWFDFTVNSAYTAPSYESYTPAEGNQMLVVEITVQNTFEQSTPMADFDFQAQWGSDGEDDYAYPITDDDTEAGLPTLNDDQLPHYYELAVDESCTGLLVYEVPDGNKDFSISYQEVDEEETVGDMFFVYFPAEEGSTAAA